MATYYIYCDESCHLENDGFDVMVLGALTCPENKKVTVFNDIRKIKMIHGLSSWLEIKWTKVSKSKVEFYIDLVDYFFNNDYLSFRGVIASNKSKLDHFRYNQSDYDLWYYKMYFYLLDPIIDPVNRYRIFIDIKDTKGGPKVKKLHNVLCNNIYDFKHDVINDIKQINSEESEILQLTDLFIGALSYYYRNLHKNPNANLGKKSILDHLHLEYGINPSISTPRYEQKFNIFIWQPRRCEF